METGQQRPHLTESGSCDREKQDPGDEPSPEMRCGGRIGRIHVITLDQQQHRSEQEAHTDEDQ